MDGRIKIINELLDYPYALFQEHVCIFETGLDDNDVLAAFSKKILKISELNTITLTYFRGVLFLSIKFEILSVTYSLILVMSERKTATWDDQTWEMLIQKVQACIAILADQAPLPQKKINQTDLLTTNKHVSENLHQLALDAEIDFTDNYQFENNFIQALQKGDILVLNKMVQNLSKINQTTLSKDSLLQRKYRFVSLITLVTRASIKYGCPSTTAYRLSDQYIRKLDEVALVSDFTPLINQMLMDFSILIKTRPIPYSQNIIKHASDFIYRNLYEDLSNQTIAAEINVHPAYLSSVFKKNVGVSLRNFITTARINEAKYLITNTDLTFKEISASLQFANQSYFCKVFKAETGYTPKEFQILF